MKRIVVGACWVVVVVSWLGISLIATQWSLSVAPFWVIGGVAFVLLLVFVLNEDRRTTQREVDILRRDMSRMRWELETTDANRADR